ncbi:efflux RND transporter periplasmic adaptor subunit [Thiohalocapsa marina]|uniref:Efflux RND transporter periplasmic adaptor subunit n=1 Tax=Thiohalocapsa marina TaxID=424902 RepID=A0A5M8FNS5_9GAMM|nr:efflux RND transporter periplasmic adaptor subunit [Thiohalocapsa marina]KAA6182572.1 efflux RND transporter periplasmic adaptor subunit [Thiohalocapsa marina]
MRYRVVLLLIPLLFATLTGCREASAPAPVPSVPVVLLTLATEDVSVTAEEVGRAEASNSVTLLPRVGGQILSRHFDEGQAVAAGDLLYSVDPAPYQARLRSAEAKLARTQAELQYAQDEADRYSELESKRTVSRSTAEQFSNAAMVLREAIRAQEAEVEQARLNLDYCQIHSPIPGRAGAYLANEGAFVEAYRTPLVVVNQIDPIDIVFALPEARLAELLQALATGRVEVTATVRASGLSRGGGVMHFIDNSVDPDTGTILLKARFDNPDAFFWPGQFVKVRLPLRAIADAILLPSEAVVAGPQGPSVFVVSDGKAELRAVQTAERLADRIHVIGGLSPGEAVVVEGQNKLKPGSPIRMVESSPTAGTP